MTVAEKIHELVVALLPCDYPPGRPIVPCQYPTPRTHESHFWCYNCQLRPAAEDALRKAYDFGADGLLASRQKVSDLVGKLSAAEAEAEEAAHHVESVICMRTRFTGDPPYVGWKGLGLALTEALDERDRLRKRCQNHHAVNAELCGECLKHALETGAVL